MHEHFPRWCQEAHLKPSAEFLKARTKGIEAAITDIGPLEALDLVRMLLGRVPIEEYRKMFTDSLASADPGFSVTGSERELAVMAGATIAEALEEADETANAAALATVCASFAPYRDIPPAKDILDLATGYLATQSASLRSGIRVPELTRVSLDLKAQLDAHRTACEEADLPSPKLAPPLIDSIAAVENQLKELSKSTGEVVDAMGGALQLLLEESNVHWWRFNEYSREFDSPMRELDFPTVCITAGKELADLVEILPGPLAAGALLAKAISAGRTTVPKSLQLKDAVNSLPKTWRERTLKGVDKEHAQGICPVHLALGDSLLTEGPDDGAPVYKRSTGLQASSEFDPRKLATQMYRECLLLKALSE